MRWTAVVLALYALAAAPAASADKLGSLAYLVGTWNCTYSNGAQSSPYAATYAYGLGGNWLRERDVWNGGSVENLFTYDAQQGVWRVAVLRSDRTMQILQAPASGSHLVYHSVYPDASAVWTFDRRSANRFTQLYVQTTGGKTVRFSDDCRKSP